MPFLRDEGPPVSKDTIQRARESLPLEYGFQIVNETGREVLLVRVPKAKPDYLHDLGDVAFYVTLDTIRSCKDVLLIGHEKTARLEPQLLRDNIRAQDREDAALVTDLRRRLSRDFGQQMLQSPSNFIHQAFAVRIPAQSISEFSPEHVTKIREMVEQQRARFEACQYAYVVADRDHERLGRRVLLELLGQPSATEATPAATEPAPAPMTNTTPATPATPAASQAFSFPITPGTESSPRPTAANAASSGPVALPAIFNTHHNTPAQAPAAPAIATAAAAAPAIAFPPTPSIVPVEQAPTPTQPVQIQAMAPTQAAPQAPAGPAVVDDHEEYAIISKPKAAPAPVARAPAPTPEPGVSRDVHDEYEIVSKPKPAAAPAPAPAAMPPPTHAANASVHSEYEIVSKPKPAAAAEEIAAAPAHPEAERKVARATEEFEVYTSKPKPRDHEAPAITPPGQGGFQAALNAATSTAGHVPMKTKQYEIMGGRPAPKVEAASPVARMLSRPHDDPRVQPAMPAKAPVAAPPSPDNGVPVVPQVAPARSELVLAQKFKDAGYEIVEGLRAQGTQFAFAAHKPNGRRVLLKRSPEFSGEEAANLSGLVTALGADICLVVADKVAPGTRLATWGTRIEVYTPAEAGVLTF